MSIVAPRSAPLPAPVSSSPASASPVGGDRTPVQGVHDFETVLRGRRSARTAPVPAGASDRARHADSSTDTSTDTSSHPPVDSSPDLSEDRCGAALSSATGAASRSDGDSASGSDPGPAAQAPAGGWPGETSLVNARPLGAATASTSSAPATAPAVVSPVGDLAAPITSAGSPTSIPTSIPASVPAEGQQAGAPPTAAAVPPGPTGSTGGTSPSVGAPARVDDDSTPVVTLGVRRLTTATQAQGADATGDPAMQAAATTPASAPAYPVPTPGTTPAGVGTPVATPAEGRPAQATLPPQAQVLNAVSPLVTTADGTHRLTVHLAPAHLGAVQVQLEVVAGEVTVRLTAADPATGDALRHGAAELRSHLERIGLRAGAIDVHLAPADPVRDPGAAVAGERTTPDAGDRAPGQRDPRDPGPWPGADPGGAGRGAPGDGAWQRHDHPLEGWAPRDRDRQRSGGLPAATPAIPDRPLVHDVRVDVRM